MAISIRNFSFLNCKFSISSLSFSPSNCASMSIHYLLGLVTALKMHRDAPALDNSVVSIEVGCVSKDVIDDCKTVNVLIFNNLKIVLRHCFMDNAVRHSKYLHYWTFLPNYSNHKFICFVELALFSSPTSSLSTVVNFFIVALFRFFYSLSQR